VGAFFDDATVVKDEDPIDLTNRRQPVGESRLTPVGNYLAMLDEGRSFSS
jgi:hypothetical protein